MNEKLKELAEQAGMNLSAFQFSGTPIKYEVTKSELEKFAGLIVKECAEVCMKEIDIGWAMAPKSPWMAKQILEHFGVEE